MWKSVKECLAAPRGAEGRDADLESGRGCRGWVMRGTECVDGCKGVQGGGMQRCVKGYGWVWRVAEGWGVERFGWAQRGAEGRVLWAVEGCRRHKGVSRSVEMCRGCRGMECRGVWRGAEWRGV